jgi:NIMA (never in mitosis gene a)-related kinase
MICNRMIVGDLSFHIKRRQQNGGERFTETEIFNWFVQLCLALEYIHGRKVLHRDLKSQNVFLTGNNTVKLGDFGISRVLENTNAAAMTVVGTPYYMSPEVCQNQPYTFKSDVWALGCVLYELCTLKHAFSADNLLGLVYKIVQDKYEPIPACYSPELQALISALLNKNAQERPSVA